MGLPLPVAECPALIRTVADEFKDFMTVTEYRAFVAVLCGAVYGFSSYSDVFRYIMFSPSVSSLGDLFNAEHFAAKLNRRHRRRLLRLMVDLEKDPARYQWVIDDTLVTHDGKKIWGTYTWHDHVSKGYVFGHKILVLGIEDKKRRLLIPVFWEILHRDLSDDVEEANELPETAEHEKGWEVALRLVDQAVAFGFPRLTVVADSWFAGEELFVGLEKRQLSYVIEVKSNRNVARHGTSHYQKHRVDAFFEDRERSLISYHGKTKFSAEAVVVFKDSELRQKVVAVANKRDLDDKVFAFYVTNQLAWNASRVWAAARDRWGIEVQFRELKQLFTFGEAAVRSQQAVETSISVSAIALTVIRLQQIAEADASENQHARPRPAGAIVRDLQLESLRKCVSKLASPRENGFHQHFARRLNRQNLNGKPAEYRRKAEKHVNQRVQRKKAA
jgi:hypothetical protein